MPHSVTRLRDQRVFPAQSGTVGEVCVVGVQLAVVREGEGGEVGVGNSGAGSVEFRQFNPVLIGNGKERDVGRFEPALHLGDGIS